MADGVCIGIDFGESASRVALFNLADKRLEPLCFPGLDNENNLPSIVSFTGNRVVVGRAHSRDTIFGAKTLTEIPFESVFVQRFRQRIPFDVVPSAGKPVFKVKRNGMIIQQRPQDISNHILNTIREVIERSLRRNTNAAINVRSTAITVPANYNMLQKKAILEAAHSAGLVNVHLVTDPVASIYGYIYEQRRTGHYDVLMIDFGGGTFEVSLANIQSGSFEIIAIDGDEQLGGREIDFALREYLARKIQEVHGLDCLGNRGLAQKLLEKCESLKISLSSLEEDSINLNALLDSDEQIVVTRAELEAICMDIFQQVIQIVKRFLDQNNIVPNSNAISEILLLGGSMQIPKIRKMLIDDLGFSSNQINGNMPNGNQLVAYGAALYAAKRAANNSLAFGACQLNHQNVLPFPLSMLLPNGEYVPLCSSQSPFPYTFTPIECTTSEENQTCICVELYERRTFIASATVYGLPPKSIGEIAVKFMLETNCCGIPQLTASMANGTELVVEIHWNGSRFGRYFLVDIENINGKNNANNRHVNLAVSDAEKKTVECPVCFEYFALSNVTFCVASSGINGKHAFCNGCISENVNATHQIGQLKHEAYGLPCMASEQCSNSLLMVKLKHFVDPAIIKQLEKRFADEILAKANVNENEQFVKCQKCEFPVEMNCSPKVVQIFHCPNCLHEFCRRCNNSFDWKHISWSCEEGKMKERAEKGEREVERLINEAIVRRCPTCQTAFVKQDGCNWMQCRCGVPQCYICRQINVDHYTHFCDCGGDRNKKGDGSKCDRCGRSCGLFEDAEVRNEQIRQRIMEQAEKKNHK